MADHRHPRGLIDTSVVIDLELAGRKARGRRAVDLFIAATAVAAGLPLYTRNPDDFGGLSDVLEIVSV